MRTVVKKLVNESRENVFSSKENKDNEITVNLYNSLNSFLIICDDSIIKDIYQQYRHHNTHIKKLESDLIIELTMMWIGYISTVIKKNKISKYFEFEISCPIIEKTGVIYLVFLVACVIIRCLIFSFDRI